MACPKWDKPSRTSCNGSCEGPSASQRSTSPPSSTTYASEVDARAPSRYSCCCRRSAYASSDSTCCRRSTPSTSGSVGTKATFLVDVPPSCTATDAFERRRASIASTASSNFPPLRRSASSTSSSFASGNTPCSARLASSHARAALAISTRSSHGRTHVVARVFLPPNRFSTMDTTIHDRARPDGRSTIQRVQSHVHHHP
mmetsp:Transcript_5508/g.34050  ORF Transcript_5508/g.34050 Transcript_5508/m.34050 type:complete len:200 (-) Transcript_5508:184-783(-)